MGDDGKRLEGTDQERIEEPEQPVEREPGTPSDGRLEDEEPEIEGHPESRDMTEGARDSGLEDNSEASAGLAGEVPYMERFFASPDDAEEDASLARPEHEREQAEAWLGGWTVAEAVEAGDEEAAAASDAAVLEPDAEKPENSVEPAAAASPDAESGSLVDPELFPETEDDDAENVMTGEELSLMIEEICTSKAEEFRMLGYEYVTGSEIWECVSDKYRKQGLPALHRIVNDILSLKVTSFMNWMTMSAFKDPRIM
ncbi:post-transcriptional regulator [Paenibacillus filicis]|uniref:Post-transcriptional regulator n=1 Tax=Paenibacillus filicis TaxID=669464 RepID=A0ABU9DRN6_9BACL